MKKSLLIACAFVAIILSSCRLNEGKPFENNPYLVSYIEHSADETTVLTGVKDRITDKPVIPMGEYKSVDADLHTITCTDLKGYVTAYKTDGTLLGRFEMFTHWADTDVNYYLGVYYKDNVFYFPNTDLVINAKERHYGVGVLFLYDGLLWNLVSFNGDLLSQIPVKDIIIINDVTYIDKMLIVYANPEGKGWVMYDKDGTLIKTLTDKEFKKLEKKLTKIAPIGSDHKSYNATVENIDKLK